jgi:hypothetical protein
MQVNRKPSDPYVLEIEALFDRWADELDELEIALGPPKTQSHEPGAKPGVPPSDVWRAEMRERRNRLHPLAREMAEVYLNRLDAAGRHRARELVAKHKWINWQFEGMCNEYFKRALQSHAKADLDMALTMIVLYGDRSASYDFSRTLAPFFAGLAKRGLDAAGIFRDRLELTEDGDPEHGTTRSVFVRCARAGEYAESFASEIPSVVQRKPSDAYELELEGLFDRWSIELGHLESTLGPPKSDPPIPGEAPSEAWRVEMQERDDRLHPLAREMAIVYLGRLAGPDRGRAQTLVAAHPWMSQQFAGMCSEYFDRALQSHAQGDIDVALAMIALYDDGAARPGFGSVIHAFIVGLEQRGIDSDEVFRDRLGLTEHGDPERGARALFLRCAAAGEDVKP